MGIGTIAENLDDSFWTSCSLLCRLGAWSVLVTMLPESVRFVRMQRHVE